MSGTAAPPTFGAFASLHFFGVGADTLEALFLMLYDLLLGSTCFPESPWFGIHRRSSAARWVSFRSLAASSYHRLYLRRG